MSVEDIASTLKCDQHILSMIYYINSEQEDGKFIILLNKTISSSKYRLKGLELLNANIEKLPLQIVLENAFLWINICLGHHHKCLKQIKMTIIGKVIERAYKDQDFTKKLLADHMTKILELCLSSQVNHYEMESALITLNICLNRYGSWFGSYKSRIELFLVNILFCQYKNVIEIAGVTFVQLQQVGGAGVDGINHRQNFSATFHKMCVTTHKLLDKFFEHETELEQFDISNEEDFIIQGVLCSSKLNLYIENCIIFIKTMMLKGFPTVKDIKPIEVLKIIVRGTAFHLCLSGSENTLEKVHFSVWLNNIQMKLLELLNVLILWCQGNSLPFSYTISKVLIDCLARSQTCKCFKINSYFRENVYMALNYWIRISRCALHVNFQTKLIDCILEDITIAKDEVKLIVNRNDNAASKSKKVLKGQAEGEHNSYRSLSDMESSEKEKVCCAALVTLKYLISNCWLRINIKKLQTLYGILIGTTQEVLTKKPVNPYTNATCQEKLFEVLVTFYQENSLPVFPNVNVALYILNKGRNSKNLKIATACTKGISYLEVLCQPICPSVCGTENSPSIQLNTVQENDENEIDLSQNSIFENHRSRPKLMESVTDNSPQANENHIEDVEKNSIVNDSSVHILDIQVVTTSNVEESPQSSLEIVTTSDSNLNETGNINFTTSDGNKVCLISKEDVKIKENISGGNLSEETFDNSLQQSGNDESDEPPNKMLKLEVQSIDKVDDFVDEVKDY